ncbi:hypothetical protein CP883_09705 [Cutibacterium acnes]|nr:hypothetical protein CP883_09705 [Cutibacterium acnes]
MRSIYYKGGGNMFEKDRPRYATQQIASNVSVEIQVLLWRIIDSRRNNQEPLDYLQVFHLQRSGDRQRITNKQEQPPMEMVVKLELKESQPIDTTIWIVDDGFHCTMMFPNEY